MGQDSTSAILAQHDYAVGLPHIERPGEELPCALAKVREPDEPIHPLRQQMAHLSFERSVIRSGLPLQPFDNPIIKVAYRQIAHR